MTNILLIGIGPHSKRIYLPLIEKYRQQYDLDLKAIVEIAEKREDIEEYLTLKGYSPDIYFVDYKNEDEFSLDEEDKRNLLKIIEKNQINAIILSTNPLAHKAYIDFAIENGINILMDKPIIAKSLASMDSLQASAIYEDYEEIVRKYREQQERFPGLIVSCLSQRRYHPAVNKIRSEIERIYERTNCPVTSFLCEHSDGQWRMPDEVISEKYHGYTEGIGKCSHSGYHFFDIMHWFSEVIKDESKKYDKITCYSSFIRPKDWITQLNIKDYQRLFGDSYTNGKFKITDAEFIEKTKGYGEIDAHITFSFYKDNKKIFNMQLSLLHNGFSRRSWVNPRGNLYKGNGRVRHEYYSIHQGPFQSIKYESYQSDEIDNNTLFGSGEVGGELHSDVLIFRNSKAIGVDLPPMEKIQFGIVNESGLKGYSRGHQEDARADCFKEFMLAVKGEIPKGKLKSSIDMHKGSVILMSLAYLSAAKESEGKNPIAEYVGGILG